MSEKKFPAVVVIKEFLLGVEVGTKLVFDPYTDKYVSLESEETIFDDESYYYSGSAVAIDPSVIMNNIGEFFEEIASPVADVPTPEPIADDSKTMPEEELAGGDAAATTEEKKKYSLVMDCSCGHRTFVETFEVPVIDILLDATKEDSSMVLACEECGTEFKVYFAKE